MRSKGEGEELVEEVLGFEVIWEGRLSGGKSSKETKAD